MVQTTLTVVKTRRARAAHHPRPHPRPQRDGDRGQLQRRQLQRRRGRCRYTLVVAFGAAMVGSLFSSDAWNGVTFAAAEVKNPVAQPAARAAASARGWCACCTSSRTSPTSACCPSTAWPTGATVVERGIRHATQDRVATAVVETIFGASARVDHGGRDPHLHLRLQQRAHPLRRARALRDGARRAVLQDAPARSTRTTCPPSRWSCSRSGRRSSA